MSPLLASHGSPCAPAHTQLQLVVEIYATAYLFPLLLGLACLGIRWILGVGPEDDGDLAPRRNFTEHPDPRRRGPRAGPSPKAGKAFPTPARIADPRHSLALMNPKHEGEAMDRRELLGALGMGAAGMTVFAGREAAADEPHPHHHDPAHGECLKACLLASQVCNEAFHYSFGHLKDGHKDHARVADLTVDCQAFASLAAAMLARESDMMGHACAACAEVCKACAEECRKHDDKQLKECVDACLACEKSCRAMAAHALGHEHHAG